MTAVLLTLVVVLTPLCLGLAWDRHRWKLRACASLIEADSARSEVADLKRELLRVKTAGLIEQNG